MVLKITEQNGFFLVDGPINATTSESLKNYLNIIIDNYKRVTINIDKVNQIDKKGLSVLRELYLNDLNYNRGFSIVGCGSKEIYDDFKFEIPN